MSDICRIQFRDKQLKDDHATIRLGTDDLVVDSWLEKGEQRYAVITFDTDIPFLKQLEMDFVVHEVWKDQFSRLMHQTSPLAMLGLSARAQGPDVTYQRGYRLKSWWPLSNEFGNAVGIAKQFFDSGVSALGDDCFSLLSKLYILDGSINEHVRRSVYRVDDGELYLSFGFSSACKAGALSSAFMNLSEAISNGNKQLLEKLRRFEFKQPSLHDDRTSTKTTSKRSAPKLGISKSIGIPAIVTRVDDDSSDADLQAKAQVFICHSSLDKSKAIKIARSLERKGIGTWLDKNNLLVGDDFTDKIESAIADSRFVAVLLSPNFIKNGPWANKEYKMALERQVKQGKDILLPCMLDTCKPPGFLTTTTYADFRTSHRTGMRELSRSITLRTAGS